MWSRVIRWIARAEIADAQQKAFVDGAKNAYAEGWNQAMLTMQAQIKEAQAELEFVRALFPIHRSHRNESKRVH